MAYVKTTWETGDVITAEKLNNMEGGIEANSVLFVGFDNEYKLTETWKAIHDKIAGNGLCIIVDNTEEGKLSYLPVLCVYADERQLNYKVFALEYDITTSAFKASAFTSTSAEDYPA